MSAASIQLRNGGSIRFVRADAPHRLYGLVIDHAATVPTRKKTALSAEMMAALDAAYCQKVKSLGS